MDEILKRILKKGLYGADGMMVKNIDIVRLGRCQEPTVREHTME